MRVLEELEWIRESGSDPGRAGPQLRSAKQGVIVNHCEIFSVLRADLFPSPLELPPEKPDTIFPHSHELDSWKFVEIRGVRVRSVLARDLWPKRAPNG